MSASDFEKLHIGNSKLHKLILLKINFIHMNLN